MTYPEINSTGRNTAYNNNIVWKNVTVIDSITDGLGDNDVIVANTYPEPVLINLRLEAPVSELGDTFLDYGDVVINLEQELFDNWTDNGQQGEGFEIIEPNSLRMLSPDSTLIAEIPIDANEKFTAYMRFDFPEEQPCKHADLYYVDVSEFVRCDETCTENCTIAGDVDENCVVDFNDVKIIADNWLAIGYELTGDVYPDWQHTVNLRDFAALAENWSGVAVDIIGGNRYEIRMNEVWQ
jgi:hypothetical protein